MAFIEPPLLARMLHIRSSEPMCKMHINNRSHGATGSVLVEFAFAMPFLLFVLFGGLELLQIVFAGARLHHAVMGGSRLAAMSYADQNPDAVREFISQRSGYEVTPPNFFLCNDPDLSCNPNERGRAGEWMHLRAVIPVKILLGHFQIQYAASASYRNEPRSLTSIPGNL